MAKKFMFVCLGILALAGAYAVGANNSVAQVGGTDVVATYQNGGPGGDSTIIVTANGDFYARRGVIQTLSSDPIWTPQGEWTYMGNCFSGGAVNSQGTTIGGVKGLFR